MSVHCERQKCSDVVHYELVGLMGERGGHESRDRVCASQFWGDFAVSLSRETLWWEQRWVRGIRGVCLLGAAAA